MRNIIPITVVAATLLAGCRSPARVNKATTLASNSVASTNAVVANPAPVGTNTVASASAMVATPAPGGSDTVASTSAVVANPTPVGSETVASANAVAAIPSPVGTNTPAEALSENVRLGNLGAAFIVILAIVAAMRPRPSAFEPWR
jgi:outer membrane murein-binding lipoprotein Lpp